MSYKDKKWLEQQLKHGKSLSQIARECGVYNSTIWRWAIKFGLIKSRTKSNSLSSQIEGTIKDKIIKLYREGFTIREIARLYNIKETYLATLLQQWGIKKDSYIDFQDTKTIDYNDVERLWSIAEEYSRALERIDKRQKEAKIKIQSKDNYILLVFLGDMHIGSRFTDYRRLREDIEMISNTPNVYAILMGDMYENIVLRELWTARDNVMTPKIQVELVKDVIRKISHKLLAILIGDHEMFSEYGSNRTIIDELLTSLSCPFLGFGGLLHLQYNTINYKIAIAHRYRYNSSFNLTHVAKRFLDREYDADICVIAHTHLADIEEFPLRGRYRIAVRTGTYKLYDTYLASKGLNRLEEVLTPCIILRGDKFEMMPFIDIRKGINVVSKLNNSGG